MLAAMFMQGVEHALIANDACGAPISWLMCCPWLFFDGKIFHRKLLKANSAKNLLDLCDNRVSQSILYFYCVLVLNFILAIDTNFFSMCRKQKYIC